QVDVVVGKTHDALHLGMDEFLKLVAGGFYILAKLPILDAIEVGKLVLDVGASKLVYECLPLIFVMPIDKMTDFTNGKVLLENHIEYAAHPALDVGVGVWILRTPDAKH